jgi:hypothetical protein
MKVVVEHVRNGGPGPGADVSTLPGVVTVKVLGDDDKPKVSCEGQPIPDDGIEVAVGQRAYFEISDEHGSEPDLDDLWIEAAS